MATGGGEAVKFFLVAICLGCAAVSPLAAAGAAAGREVAAAVWQRWGAGAAGDSLEAVARSVTAHPAAARPLLRAGGHGAHRALRQAGAQADEVIALHARHGDALLPLLDDATRLPLLLRYGDDAAEAMLRHPGLAAPLVARYGADAARALASLGRPAGQRFALLESRGFFTGAGAGMLGVVARHGERGLQFLWRHKKILAISAVATAFLADPEAFLNGSRDLADLAVRPVLQRLPWLSIVLIVAGLFFARLLFRRWWRRRRTASA